jgi:hypothetical protein
VRVFDNHGEEIEVADANGEKTTSNVLKLAKW